MKYDEAMGSGVMTYIPSFINILYYVRDNRTTDDSKVVILTSRPRSATKNHYFSASSTHFC
jgi:hypothetical protein